MTNSTITAQSMLDILAEMEAQRKAAGVVANETRHELTQKFLIENWSTVTIDFAGSGDSGSIDNIMVQTGTNDPEYLDTKHPIYKEIESFAYKFLESTNVDWYNNDGGQGEIKWDLSEVPFKFTANVDQNETISKTAYSCEEVA